MPWFSILLQQEKHSVCSNVFIYSRPFAKRLGNSNTSITLNGPGYLIAPAIVWKNHCSTHKKCTWSVKRNLNEGQEVQHGIFQGKRLLACREGTPEMKIWTECLWLDNCRFFFVWHSTGSLAWGYSNKQKELGVVTSHVAEDCRSADDNDVSCCWRPQPGPYTPTFHRQAKCSSS